MTLNTENKELIDQFFDRLNDRDLSVVDALCADDFAVENNRKGTNESVIGPDGLKEIYEEYYAAFPDFRHEIDELVAEGDLVAVFMTTMGTHEGEFRGIRPTGNEVAIEDNGLLRIRNGKIVDARPLSDMLGLFEQLGVGLDR